MALLNTFTIVTPTLLPRVQRGGLERVARGLAAQQREHEWEVAINTSGATDFNRSMNRMIARAHGEWIISVQDFIEIPEGALDYIASLEPAFYTFPVGKISADSDEPRWDWRISKDGDIHWQEWEICFGAAPREWLIAIGGFDEQLDQAWGFDNVNVGFRAYEAGYPLKCDPTLRAIALDHDAFMPHPLKAQRDPALHNRRLDEFRRGQQVRDIFKYMVQS